MARAASDPLPRLGKRQGATRVAMATQGAADRHEAVAHEPAAEVADVLSGGRCNREALHAVGERHGSRTVSGPREAIATFPVLVEQVAVAQVRDTGAPDLP